MYRLLIFLSLWVFWVVLSGLFDPFHLSMGAVCAGLVTWLSSDLYFQDRTLGFQGRVREAWLFSWYGLWLLGQIVIANVQVLRLAVAPNGPRKVDPRVVRFRTKLRTEFARYVLAQSITLTPGTVTIKIVRDEFYVHAINQAAAEGLDGTMEMRIARIYEPELEGGVRC